MEICKDCNFCGGCIYQGVEYSKQLEEKGATVEKLLEDLEVEEYQGIEACPSQYRYRNKMEYTFGDLVKDGPMCLGMHKKKNYMSIVTVDECQLVHEDFNKVLRGTLDFCVEKGYSFYHKRSHKGLMRNLLVRRGVRTGEILINIITSSQFDFDEQAYAQMLHNLELEEEIVGILHTINDGLADAVICDELRIIEGRDYYMEKIMDLDFKVSTFSFFQTNVEAAERLYKEAIELIDNYEGKKVFDLYCGTGTITQAMASKAGSAVGVELVVDAVESARENAKLNNLDNCEFIAGDVFEVLSSLSEKPDVIVVDPPRVGIQPKALEKILSYGVEQIVYISCNPKTLATNLKWCEQYGYKIKTVKAYDNFPMTKHIEAVTLLVKER